MDCLYYLKFVTMSSLGLIQYVFILTYWH